MEGSGNVFCLSDSHILADWTGCWNLGADCPGDEYTSFGYRYLNFSQKCKYFLTYFP